MDENKENKHPGPFCIVCKKPFGNPSPIGCMIKDGVSVPWFHVAIVKTGTKSFCQCLDCMKSEREEVKEFFISLLTEEQRLVFGKIQSLNSDISSYVILMN